MIEEHVIKLAELQAELKGCKEKAATEVAAAKIDEEIAYHEKQIEHQRGVREILIRPYTEEAEELKTTIESLYAQIIDEWTGEHKTMVFDAGTLKFRTTQSLKIHDEELLLHDIIEHTSIGDAGKTYIKGFNLAAVKKYMTVHPQQPEVAELTSKTTVKLEQ